MLNEHSKELTSVVLWYMDQCIATVNRVEKETRKKTPIETICFLNKVYLAFKQIDILTIAPPAVKFLNHLSCLQLQNNNIQELPSGLWHLTSLEELNLGHNRIRSIPKEISLLTRLRELFLHDNELQEISPDIAKLKCLAVLDLTNNQLNCLPGEILELELWKFWTEGNAFSCQTICPDILSLKSICAQIIGTMDSLHKESFQESLPWTIQQEILRDASCSICNALLFHLDSFVLHNTYLFKACSQACLFEIKRTKLR